jgi:hypothetical protein
MTTTTMPDVPLPSGAEPDVWVDESPPLYRVLYGVSRGIAGRDDVLVGTTAIQFADGRIDDGSVLHEPPHVYLNDDALTSVQARELAALLIEAADEVHGWAGRSVGAPELRDVHRRIRNILDRWPVTSWDLAEAKTVLAALGEIVRGRPESERLPFKVNEDSEAAR